mmetsp:Transcript_69062/g.184059  ORF Transcript_69062/g.184059 Transcript_69062/m.184059 type:complete len:252 (-) Transcript_69062:327-1082(-)
MDTGVLKAPRSIRTATAVNRRRIRMEKRAAPQVCTRQTSDKGSPRPSRSGRTPVKALQRMACRLHRTLPGTTVLPQSHSLLRKSAHTPQPTPDGRSNGTPLQRQSTLPYRHNASPHSYAATRIAGRTGPCTPDKHVWVARAGNHPCRRPGALTAVLPPSCTADTVRTSAYRSPRRRKPCHRLRERSPAPSTKAGTAAYTSGPGPRYNRARTQSGNPNEGCLRSLAWASRSTQRAATHPQSATRTNTRHEHA